MRYNLLWIAVCITSAIVFVCPLTAQEVPALELSVAEQIDAGNIFFPQLLSNSVLHALVYQEIEYDTSDSGVAYVSFAIKQAGTWRLYSKVSTPIPFARETPPLFFSALIRNNSLIIALSSDAHTITIYEYTTENGQVESVATIETALITVTPRLFQRKDGSVICFLNSRNIETEQQSIYFTISNDIRNWSSLRTVAQVSTNQASLLLTYAFLEDREVVVFQGIPVGQSGAHQLYFTYSDDNGARWSRPRVLTQFRLPDEEEAISLYENQRPTIVAYQDNILLSWERQLRNEQRRIIYTELDRKGNTIVPPIPVTTYADLSSRPTFLIYKDRKLINWSGGQNDERFIAIGIQNRDGTWKTERIGRDVNADFPSLSVYDDDSIIASWIENSTQNVTQLYTQNIQFSIPRIILRGANFDINTPSNEKIVVIEWTQQNNAQILDGFRYIWSFGERSAPLGDVQLSARRNSIQVVADREGVWYFALQPRDLFGNWLEPVTLQYQYDSIAPESVEIIAPPLDSGGFVTSNTFSIDWRTPEDNDVSGYYVDLKKVGRSNQLLTDLSSTPSPPITLNYRDNSIQNINIENGLWELRIAAFDYAGNSGPLTSSFYRLNKYTPVTLISQVSSRTLDSGMNILEISGRGFLEEGQIDTCILDIDKEMPYDYQFMVKDGGCAVVNNTLISNISLARVKKGEYYVGLNHTNRGMLFSGASFELLPGGTVLFGDFNSLHTPDIAAFNTITFTADQLQIGMLLLILLLGLLSVFLFTRLLKTIAEGRLWRKEVYLLDSYTNMPYTTEGANKIKRLRQKGVSLRIKFTVFITLLVITVILIMSIILGNTSLRRQEQILAQSLRERVSVLLDSISTQAGNTFLNSSNQILDLEPLINQLSVLDEAQYITITGTAREQERYGAVWATNDARILNFNSEDAANEITLSTPQFNAGDSVLQDGVSEAILPLVTEINETTSLAVADIPQKIIDTNQQIVSLITQSTVSGGEIDAELLEDLDIQLRTLTVNLNSVLRDAQSDMRSNPVYNIERLDKTTTEYVFYQPIIAWNADRVGLSGQFYQGLVRIGISTDTLLAQLESAQREIILTTLIIAILATIAGIGGASVLAAIVIAPINRVVRGVEIISETEDKSDLKDHTITIHSKDELSILAHSVNQMTQGLVQASDANKELIVGKEVQKLFIPLAKDDAGNKLSLAHNVYDGIEIAGYYEGAHGVSGDYFSYAQLDGDNFAIIKCDVSGKGVPAALIMVEVATIFADFMRQSKNYQRTNALSYLVTRINDLLESMQFQGRFAALTVAIVNQQSGRVRITNAGDKHIHIYRHRTKKVQVLELPETPAAGVFPSDMLPNGFKESKFTINTGDCLLFFTDGIDESRRLMRNTDLSVIQHVENGRTVDASEEFGIERIHDIAVCAMTQSVYAFNRMKEIVSAPLKFDFNNIPISAMSVVKGIVAAEHIFRLYPIAHADGYTSTEKDKSVYLDKEVIAFIADTFSQFPLFFGHEITQKSESSHQRYSNLLEEDQYDDITIVALRKK